MEKATNEQIVHWIAEDFATSRGDQAKHIEVMLAQMESRGKFNLADFNSLPAPRRKVIIEELTRIFIRKHEGENFLGKGEIEDQVFFKRAKKKLLQSMARMIKESSKRS